eukprot:Hpha_TRINITY_DN16274_c7_g7::TRINITY_DN16274_c7_g7_i2::g.15897::m.15897
MEIASAKLKVCSDWMIREGDTETDVRIKRGLTPVAFVGVVLLSLGALRAALADHEWSAGWNGFGFVIWTLYFCAGRAGMDMGTVLDVALPASVVFILALDLLQAATLQSQRWSVVVICLDVGLVFNRDRVPLFAIPLTVIYLLVIAIEAQFRLGIYELPGEEPKLCSCAEPPCSLGAEESLLAFAWLAFVLVIDFYLTRRFAHDLRHQLQRVKSSVEVAAEITRALTRYDVDSAAAAITRGDDLPEGLAASFLTLVSNLRSYKAYLPHSCLVPEAEIDSSNGDVSIPVLQPRLSTVRYSTDSTKESTNSIDDAPLDSSRSSMTSPCFLEATLRAPTRKVRVSLAAGNMIGYLSSSRDLSAQSNIEWIAADVEMWCSAVVEAKGLVDLIGGDRRYASFNARQTCGAHASAAVGVLSARGDEAQPSQWSGCVVTGQAVCGDFGSASVLRFMVLGAVSASLHPLERIAAKWRTKVLVDDEAYCSSCYNWDGELLGALIIPKRGTRPVRAFRMTSRREMTTSAEGPVEWMYEIANLGKGMYEQANQEKEVLIKAKLNSMNVEEVAEAAAVEPLLVWRVKEVGMTPC